MLTRLFSATLRGVEAVQVEVEVNSGPGDPAVVVALGSAFGDEETFRWRVDAAATGVNLPGGGQLIAPGKNAMRHLRFHLGYARNKPFARQDTPDEEHMGLKFLFLAFFREI